MATIFIMLDHEQLVARIRGRGQDDDAEIARRMATAEAELLEAPKFESWYRQRLARRGLRGVAEVLATARARGLVDHGEFRRWRWTNVWGSASSAT